MDNTHSHNEDLQYKGEILKKTTIIIYVYLKYAY